MPADPSTDWLHCHVCLKRGVGGALGLHFLSVPETRDGLLGELGVQLCGPSCRELYCGSGGGWVVRPTNCLGPGEQAFLAQDGTVED